MRCFLIIAFLAHCQALRLPVLYQDNMVIQAKPSVANLWGFLDGNQNTVELNYECVLKDHDSFRGRTWFVPKEDDDKFNFAVEAEMWTRCNFHLSQEGSEVMKSEYIIQF